MAQSNARTNATKFDVDAWAAAFLAAACSADSVAKQLLDKALELRGHVDNDKALELFQVAYREAYKVANPGLTEEEVAKARTVKNRVSDAMAVFKAAEKHLASLPGNLQRAADHVRKLAKVEAEAANDGQPSSVRAPRPGSNPKEPKEPKVEVTPLEKLGDALAALKALAGDDAPVLDLLGQLTDLAAELEELLAPEPADKAA
jgi:hypothetical protein